ncbi:UNC9-like protein [Mya arenaria]|uniref:Innexin n=1 Tax=Mya arenaria TaxID=6604 RepID=A0ABY7EM50_MYAAR|nr:UNC9-like protein [Mya arenaria]
MAKRYFQKYLAIADMSTLIIIHWIRYLNSSCFWWNYSKEVVERILVSENIAIGAERNVEGADACRKITEKPENYFCFLRVLRTKYGYKLDKVLGSVGSYAGLGKLRNDDDFIDRLSHHYSTMMLVIFTIMIMVSTKQYVEDAIQCWCPAQFTDAHVNYANQICRVSNTYQVPMEDVIPSDIDNRKERQLTYYQWVPYILLFMSILFKLPRIAWKVLMWYQWYALQLAHKMERDEKINEVTDYLDSWLTSGEHYRDICCMSLKNTISKYSCLVCGRRYGNQFITACLLTKVCYFLNAFLQYFALNSFLGDDFAAWGSISQMNNVQRWTVECVLPINLFNSKIFLFIWFWLVFVCLASLMSICTTVHASMFPLNRVNFIKKYLTLRKVIHYRGENKLVTRFVMTYLKFDGFYGLHVTAHNATDILTGQLIENLFLKYKSRYTESKQITGGEYVQCCILKL